ncbi:hypothetical protein U9M48_027041, partial [Paspalum notatum var. saurae]
YSVQSLSAGLFGRHLCHVLGVFLEFKTRLTRVGACNACACLLTVLFLESYASPVSDALKHESFFKVPLPKPKDFMPISA